MLKRVKGKLTPEITRKLFTEIVSPKYTEKYTLRPEQKCMFQAFRLL